jgi:hypothetical protein
MSYGCHIRHDGEIVSTQDEVPIIVDWIAPVSTLIGGLLGVGSTLVVDRTRWRRDQHQQLTEARRVAYVRFVTAAIETEGALHHLAATTTGALDQSSAMEVWREHKLALCREELRLIAPPTIVDAAQRVHDRLVDLRNALTTSKVTVGVKGNPGSSEWLAVYEPFDAAERNLRQLLRSDVQGSYYGTHRRASSG